MHPMVVVTQGAQLCQGTAPARLRDAELDVESEVDLPWKAIPTSGSSQIYRALQTRCQ